MTEAGRQDRLGGVECTAAESDGMGEAGVCSPWQGPPTSAQTIGRMTSGAELSLAPDCIDQLASGSKP